MQLRICTWNINLGLELDKAIKSLHGPADFKLADCFAIQEASFHKNEDAKLFAKTLGENYDFYQVHVQTPKFRWYSTKRKIKGLPQENAFVWNKKRIKKMKFNTFILPPYNNQKLSTYGKAVYRISSTKQRICLVAEGEFLKKTFRFYIVHFDVIGPVSKLKQLEFVIEHANREKKVDLEIIAGDLNTFKFFKRPSWKKLQNLAQQHNFVELTTDINWTFADKKIPVKQKLDAIFIRHESSLRYNSWALDIPGSDHLPVFANIELP